MLSEEVNYQSGRKVLPTYRLDQFTQQIGGTDFILDGNGTRTSLFEIPSVTYNPSRSYLSFRLETTADANDFQNTYAGLVKELSQIQFYGKNGTMMVDLSNIDYYTNIILTSDHKLSDLLNSTSPPLVRTNALVDGAGGRYLSTTALAPVYSTVDYTESAQYVTSGADNVAINITYNIPLSIFKNTILALDKDLYFGDITYFKIYWRPDSRIGWQDSAGTMMADVKALAGDIHIKQLYFYLAVETNPAIDQPLRQQVESEAGLNLLFDYVHTIAIPFNASTQQNFYVKYGSGMGLRLKRIYWQVYATATPAAADTYKLFDASNINGSKVNWFYTMLDSKRLIQYNVDCRDAQGNLDWLNMKSKVEGGVIQSSGIAPARGYQARWFWAENFDGLKLHEHDDNLELGIPIDTIERKYDVVATTANVAYTHYVFGVVQRRLNINRLGISVV